MIKKILLFSCLIIIIPFIIVTIFIRDDEITFNFSQNSVVRVYSEETNSRKKKEYIITSLGREILDDEIIRLKELVENGEKGMREND